MIFYHTSNISIYKNAVCDLKDFVYLGKTKLLPESGKKIQIRVKKLYLKIAARC